MPLETDAKAQKREVQADYEMWLPSNQTMAQSISRIQKEMLDVSYTNKVKFTVSNAANGCGVSKNWLTYVQKIATGQENASSVIKSRTPYYNNLLKDLYVIR